MAKYVDEGELFGGDGGYVDESTLWQEDKPAKVPSLTKQSKVQYVSEESLFGFDEPETSKSEPIDHFGGESMMADAAVERTKRPPRKNESVVEDVGTDINIGTTVDIPQFSLGLVRKGIRGAIMSGHGLDNPYLKNPEPLSNFEEKAQAVERSVVDPASDAIENRREKLRREYTDEGLEARGPNVPWTKEAPEKLQEYSESGYVDTPESLTQGYEGGRAVTSPGLGVQKAIGATAESAPGTLATMGPTAILSRLAGKSAIRALAGVVTDQAILDRVGIAAAQRAAMLAGGLSEGLQGSGSAYEATYREVMNTPPEALANNRDFVRALEAAPKDLPPAGREEYARRTIAHLAATVADAGAFAFDSVLGAAGDRYIGGATMGRQRLGSALEGLLQETLTEAPQSGGEKLFENIAAKISTSPERPVMQDVGEEAITGGIAGGLSGLGMGAGFHVGPPNPNPRGPLSRAENIAAGQEAIPGYPYTDDEGRPYRPVDPSQGPVPHDAATEFYNPDWYQDRVYPKDWIDAEVAAEEAPAPAPEPAPVSEATEEPAVSPAPVDEAAHEAATSPLNDLSEPTEAQIAAGTYKKGHYNMHGMRISIENPAGSVRQGVDPDTGEAWQTDMVDHYGYIRGTEGRDKDHIDAFIPEGYAPGQQDLVGVVDQVDPNTGLFDEHKVVFGAKDAAEAEQIYLRNYDETGPSRFAAVTMVPVADFKAWTQSGKTKVPFNPAVPRGIAAKAPKVATNAATDVADIEQKQEVTDGTVHIPLTDIGDQGRGTEGNLAESPAKRALQPSAATAGAEAGTAAAETIVKATVNSDPRVYNAFVRAAAKALGKEKGAAAVALVDARARSAGLTPQQYANARMLALKVDSKLGTEQQRQANKGAFDLGTWTRERKAIIHAFKSFDISTMGHELGHLFRQDLGLAKDGAMLRAAEEWVGAQPGESWTVDQEEKFARAFERYLRNGKAPTSSLAKVFQAFKRWLSEIYRTLKGSPIDIQITPQIRQVFDALLTEGAVLDMGKDGEVKGKDGEISGTERGNDKGLVVDKNGNPLTVYANTRGSDRKFPARREGIISHFSTKEGLEAIAPEERRALGKRTGGPATVAANLSIRKPVKVDRAALANHRILAGALLDAGALSVRDLYKIDPGAEVQKENGRTVVDFPKEKTLQSPRMLINSHLAIQLSLNGYDGITYSEQGHDFFIPLDESQVSPAAQETLNQKKEFKPVDTNSPEFKRWFSGSKVVDKNGNPMRVFHAGGTDIKKFKQDSSGLVAHFGTADAARDKVTSDVHEGLRSAKGTRTTPVYLSIKKPARMSDVHFDEAGTFAGDALQRGLLSRDDLADIDPGFELSKESSQPFVVFSDDLTRGRGSDARLIREMVTRLISKGYDGIVYSNRVEDRGNDSFIPFSPNQIKSALSNTGEFSEDERILYQGWAKWEPEVTSTGRIKGAPPHVTTQADLRRLRREIANRAKEGESGRFWYERSAKAILKIVGGDFTQAEKLIQLIAIYSPQANVDTNTVFAVNAWNQWKNGVKRNDLKVKTGAQDEKARKVLYDDVPFEGRKTNSFYLNLMNWIVENHPQAAGKIKLDPEVLAATRQPVTVDMWMFRAFGYPNEAAGSAVNPNDPGSKEGRRGENDAYAFVQNETRRLADRMGWSAHQAQAAIWTAMKARFEDPGVKAATWDKSLRMGIAKLDEEGIPSLPTDAEGKRRHRAIWRSEAMKLTAAQARANAEAMGGDFSDFLGRMTWITTWEAVPSEALGHDIFSAGPKAKRLFTREAAALIRDDAGNDLLAAKVGAPLAHSMPSSGAYAGNVNPNVLSHLVPTKGRGGFDRTTARAYARAIQYIFKQDAVPFFRPDNRVLLTEKGRDENRFSVVKVSTGKTIVKFDTQEAAEREAARRGSDFEVRGGKYAQAMLLEFDQPLTLEKEELLLSLLSGTLGDAAGFTRTGPSEVAIVNYRDDDTGLPFVGDKAFFDALQAFLDNHGNNLGIIDSVTFFAEGEYGPVHDWGSDKHGEKILKDQAGPAGSPDLQSWLHDRRADFEKLLERYSGDQLAQREQEASLLFQSAPIPVAARDREASGQGDARSSRGAVVGGIPVREDGKAHLVHFSKREGLRELDPAKHGTGISGAESRRKKNDPDNWIDRTYYAVVGGGYRKEVGLGPHRYNLSLDPSKLYDIASDPSGLIKKAQEIRAGNPFFDVFSVYERLIREAGFSGYFDSRSGAAAVFEKLSPEEEMYQPEAGLLFQGNFKPVDTESPEFKRWFAGSKVVNPDGTPMRMYHGTGRDFDRFKRRGGDIGIHFGTAGQAEDRLDFLRSTGRRNLENSRTVPVYLSIKNPLRIADQGGWNEMAMAYGLSEKFPQDLNEIDKLRNSSQVRKFLESKGYDGVVYENTGEVEGAEPYRQAKMEAWKKVTERFPRKNSFTPEMQKAPEYQEYKRVAKEYDDFVAANAKDSYIAFSPKQVKSAISNTGDFSSKDPRLLFQGPVWSSRLKSIISEKGDKALPAMQWQVVLDQWRKKGTLPAPVVEELEWSGLQEYLREKGKEKVSKADLLDFLDKHGVQVTEVIKGGELTHERLGWTKQGTIHKPSSEFHVGYIQELGNGAFALTAPGGIYRTYDTLQEAKDDILRSARFSPDDTEYSKYQLPGGKNYQEMLIALPTGPVREAIVDQDGEFIDWFDPGFDEYERRAALRTVERAGMRVEEREDSLRGGAPYRSSHWPELNILAHARFNERTDTDGNSVLFIEEVQSDWHQEGRRKGYKKGHQGFNPLGILTGDQRAIEDSNSTPDAPFKTSWPLLVIKRMIRWAAEHGIGKIAWTTGEQQAERYDLQKHVKSVVAARWKDGTYTIEVDGHDGEPIFTGDIAEKDLAAHVGKDLAEKIAAQKGTTAHRYTGLDLKVGGEGMRKFYDQMLPSMVDKFIKQYGSKVETVDVKIPGAPTEDDIRNFQSFTQSFSENSSIDIDENTTSSKRPGPSKQHGFTITDKMRDSALENGMFLFQSAWHGSPHRFEKFSTSAIGTGEGAQAYGYGLYFSGSREVAEWYREKLSGSDKIWGQITVKGKSFPSLRDQSRTLHHATSLILGEIAPNNRITGGNADFNQGVDYALRYLFGQVQLAEDNLRSDNPFAAEMAKQQKDEATEAIYFIKGLKLEDFKERKGGQLYKVELAPQEDEYLLWNKSLSEQSAKVREALKKASVKETEFIPDQVANLETMDTDFLDTGKHVEQTGMGAYEELTDRLGSDRAASEYLYSLGIRGIKYRGRGEGVYNYVIFSDNDVEITEMLYQAANPLSWNAPEDTWVDQRLIYKLQDKLIDQKRIQDAITEAGASIAEGHDVRLAEELWHKRAAKRQEDMLVREVLPLMRELGEIEGSNDASMFELYLHARHAEEANRDLKLKNPNARELKRMVDTAQTQYEAYGSVGAVADYVEKERELAMAQHEVAMGVADDSLTAVVKAELAALSRSADVKNFVKARAMVKHLGKIKPFTGDNTALSGMSTRAAQTYINSIPADKRARYEALADKWDRFIERTRETLVDYGLESQGTVDAWAAAYRHYVPLHREDMDSGMGIGQGFSVKGSASKRRVGSNRRVVDILAHIVEQREKAIVRGEKNIIAKALYGLAASHPNPDFWKLDDPPKVRDIDPTTGLVVSRVDPLYLSRPNVVVSRWIEGTEAVDHAVQFNEKDPRAMRLAESLKNLDTARLGDFFRASAAVTRFFAAMNTQYNLVFGPVNATRDLGAAMLHLTNTPLAGRQAQIMARAGKILVPLFRALNSELKGQVRNTEIGRAWNELQLEGGTTGYREMFEDAAARTKALKKQMLTGKLNAKSLWRWAIDHITMYNDALENVTRLAVYMEAIDRGMDKRRAASLAKNITINFNRKGAITTQAGALYAFFNASMQGTEKLLRTLAGPAGRKIIIGGLLLGSLQAVLLAMAGFGDDEPPGFIKERSLVLPIGGKKYITIPMPLGFNVIPNLSRVATEWALSGFKNAAPRVASILGSLLETFNPVGHAGWSAQTLTPTPVDPIVAISENRDWTGKSIAKEDFNRLKPTPGYTRAKDSSSGVGIAIAKALNFMTGGNAHVPGVLSPTPDQIDYLIGQAFGGVGRESVKVAQVAHAATSGESLPVHKVPFVSRFYGDATDVSATSSRFYENIRKLNRHAAEIEGIQEVKGNVADYVKRNPEAKLANRAEDVYKEISKLQKEKRTLIKASAPKGAIRSNEKRIRLLMESFNKQVEAAER